jgi:hypothetical protein
MAGENLKAKKPAPENAGFFAVFLAKPQGGVFRKTQFMVLQMPFYGLYWIQRQTMRRIFRGMLKNSRRAVCRPAPKRGKGGVCEVGHYCYGKNRRAGGG